MKAVVWFILVSMNVVLGLSALFLWIRCSPIQKLWDVTVDGVCWPEYIPVNFSIFSGGTLLPLGSWASLTQVLLLASLHCYGGYRPSYPTVAHYLEPPNDEERKSRRGRRHEHGVHVRRLSL